MVFENNKDKGRAGMSLAIAYFGANGYTVNIPLNDTQWYDLVIEKDGVFETVQCKATGSKDNSIQLRSCGGTSGAVYDSVLNHPITYLFCLDQYQNMFVIPVEAIRQWNQEQKTIVLRTEPTINGQGFQTYPYLVHLFGSTINKALIQPVKMSKQYFCVDCGCEISNRAKRCHSCASKAKSMPIEDMKISRDELKYLIRQIPFVEIGKKYGVTDNTIRKWCIKHNLPKTKTEIKAYSDKEWALI